MTDTTNETFGQRVKRLRESKKIRQVDLAAKAQVSWRHLIRIEQDAGGVTKADTAHRLAEALGVETHELTGAPDEDEEAAPVSDLMAALRAFTRQEARDEARAVVRELAVVNR